MNLLSNNNHILRGAAIPTAGGDVYNSGWEYTPEGEISGYSGSAIYTGECECDSAAIVDSAFNKSTAWVEEQNYLTAHQEVSNLPYVQNSSLEFNGVLISGISGSGFYAVSADNANFADLANSASESEHAISATVSQEAVHAGSADFATSANSSLNAEVATVSYVSLTALSADFVVSGWEYDESGHITGYNESAFAASGGQYEGISPIVVNNEEMKISAKSALLGVQDPLYFVEDSQTATVIGIHDTAFPTFEGTEDGKVSAINGSAIYASNVPKYIRGNNIDITDYVISVTGSVPSADIASTAIYANSSNSATYDSLGRKIVDTYLTAHQDWTTTIQNASGNAYNSAVNWVVDQHYLTAVTGDNTPYTQGANIDITNHVVSGKDWTSEIQSASAYAVDQATAQIPDVTNLPYVQNTALESNGILISSISGSGFLAESANHAFEADHANEADYVLSGWEYDENNRISGYDGSAFAGQGGTGIEYEGVLPIVVNNVEHKISAQSARLGVQNPLYFVEDSNSATVIGISGLPEVEGLMYESGLGVTGGQITSYNGSAFSAQGGGNPQVPVIGSGSVTITKPSTAVVISGKDYGNDITAASAYAYSQSTAYTTSYATGLTGKYIPYTAIDVGSMGTLTYELNSGIRVMRMRSTNRTLGQVEILPFNHENQSEAHLQIMQNYAGSDRSFWAELDGASNGNLGLYWNSAEIYPEDAATYTSSTSAKCQIQNGQIYYSANDGNEWYLNTTKYNNWEATYNTVSSNSAYWGGVQVVTATGGNTTAITSINNKPISASSATTAKYALNAYNGVALSDIYNSGRSGYAASAYINSWSVKTQVVGSTGDATGSNILYIVTGS